MSVRPEKTSIVSEIHDELERSSFVFLADYQGLSVAQLTDLRGRLRESETRVNVVKNTLLCRAAEDIGWTDLNGQDGPTMIISGPGDVTVVAKLLTKFIKDNERPALKGGRFGTEALSATDIEDMATIPSREVLLGKLVGTIAAPLSQVVGVLNQKVSSLLYVLKAVEEKKSKEG